MIKVTTDPNMPENIVRITSHPERPIHPGDQFYNLDTGEITRPGQLKVVSHAANREAQEDSKRRPE